MKGVSFKFILIFFLDPTRWGFCFDRVSSPGLTVEYDLPDQGSADPVELNGKHHLMGGATNSALDDRRLFYIVTNT